MPNLRARKKWIGRKHKQKMLPSEEKKSVCFVFRQLHIHFRHERLLVSTASTLSMESPPNQALGFHFFYLPFHTQSKLCCPWQKGRSPEATGFLSGDNAHHLGASYDPPPPNSHSYIHVSQHVSSETGWFVSRKQANSNSLQPARKSVHLMRLLVAVPGKNWSQTIATSTSSEPVQGVM